MTKINVFCKPNTKAYYLDKNEKTIIPVTIDQIVVMHKRTQYNSHSIDPETNNIDIEFEFEAKDFGDILFLNETLAKEALSRL